MENCFVEIGDVRFRIVNDDIAKRIFREAAEDHASYKEISDVKSREAEHRDYINLQKNIGQLRKEMTLKQERCVTLGQEERELRNRIDALCEDLSEASREFCRKCKVSEDDRREACDQCMVASWKETIGKSFISPCPICGAPTELCSHSEGHEVRCTKHNCYHGKTFESREEAIACHNELFKSANAFRANKSKLRGGRKFGVGDVVETDDGIVVVCDIIQGCYILAKRNSEWGIKEVVYVHEFDSDNSIKNIGNILHSECKGDALKGVIMTKSKDIADFHVLCKIIERFKNVPD